ncbi:DUF4252 domain-containing protein [Psychroflexus tropicus]|uniref:DUF4252 domain-containing protein n=1 Tax=Psychroflexus tropicus TaxID=197345 RepID=UPI000524C945|nr:DUF4252 domain-containing protein [Psychroflexus tropicus]
MKKIIPLIILAILTYSCNSNPSLQEYMVEKENSEDFISASIPTNILFQNLEGISDEKSESLRKIEKINILALTSKKDSTKLETERSELRSILNNDTYESLINFKGGEREARFAFSGSEDKIDELIFFGYDSNMGLILLRMRGNEVNVNDIYKIAQSADQFNMSALPGQFGDLLGDLE